MPTRTGRRPGASVAQVLLAMLFLAVIGSTAGYLLGHHEKQRLAAQAGDGGGSTRTGGPADTGGGQPAGDGGTPTDQATATGSAGGPVRCRPHSEQIAHERLYQVLYLRTAASEVWICRTAAGRLAYQGHSLTLGPDLVEGTTSLFLWDPDKRGDAYYVATNTDTGTGTVTEYHVWPDKLVVRQVTPPQPDRTEPATG